MKRYQPDADCKSAYVIRVRFCDTDLMGIVHHAKYFEYFEAGRVEYMHRRGFGYLDCVNRGIHLPVVETSARYRKTVRFDQRIVVDTALTEVTRVTARFTYRLLRESLSGELVAEGATLLACVGDDHAPKRIPEDIADMLCRAETHPRDIDLV